MKPTYEELEAKCALQQSKLETINKLMGVVETASDIAKAGVAELEARCAALAAENTALKKAEPAPFSKLMMEALDAYRSGDGGVPELAMLSAYIKLRDGIKTPATNAFLAEVRAIALEDFADVMADDCRHSVANFATMRAQKIRQEAAQ